MTADARADLHVLGTRILNGKPVDSGDGVTCLEAADRLAAAERVVEHIKFCAACQTSCRTLLAVADEATEAYSDMPDGAPDGGQRAATRFPDLNSVGLSEKPLQISDKPE